MLIYIFRHAKADFGKKHGEDPGLNDQGARDVRNVVSLCSSSFGFRPSLIASSPLVRARETADLAKKTLRLGHGVVVDECLYGDRKPRDVYAFLSKLRKNERVVLVSHMPLIFELLYDLMGARAEIDLLNGSIACVECAEPASKKGKLLWLVPPPIKAVTK
jgi:phosphohistidine phosphatase